MVARTFVGLLLVSAVHVVVGAGVPKTERKTPIAPTDVIHGTAEMVYDIYVAGLNFGDSVATKYAIYDKLNQHDLIELACSKIGCKKKDITDQWNKAREQLTAQKAQLTELGAKAYEPLDNFALNMVAKFEEHVPSYKGVAPKKFQDLLLTVLYLIVVMYVLLRIFLFALSTALCCVCCCGLCRQKGAKTSKTNGKAVEKGKAAMGSPAKAKGKK